MEAGPCNFRFFWDCCANIFVLICFFRIHSVQNVTNSPLCSGSGRRSPRYNFCSGSGRRSPMSWLPLATNMGPGSCFSSKFLFLMIPQIALAIGVLTVLVEGPWDVFPSVDTAGEQNSTCFYSQNEPDPQKHLVKLYFKETFAQNHMFSQWKLNLTPKTVTWPASEPAQPSQPPWPAQPCCPYLRYLPKQLFGVSRWCHFVLQIV